MTFAEICKESAKRMAEAKRRDKPGRIPTLAEWHREQALRIRRSRYEFREGC